MPSINQRLLLVTFAVVLALSAAVYGIHGLQAERIPDALLWQANHAGEAGENDRAIGFLRQYLEFRPNDHDTAIRLGELLEQRDPTGRGLAGVLGLYEKVLREAPQREEVRRRCVEIALKLNRHGDALTHAMAVLDRDPNDAKMWFYVGLCQLVQNKSDEAIQSFNTSIRHEPRQIAAYEYLAQVTVRRLNQVDEASAVIDRMVEANPFEAQAYLIRARFLRSIKKDAEALQNLDRVFDYDPENEEALATSAEILQGKGNTLRARAMLADGVELYPHSERLIRAYSWLELSTRRVGEAIAILEEGVNNNPKNADLLAPLGDLYAEQGRHAEVEAIIERLTGAKATPAQIKYLEARVAIQKRQFAAALGTLDSIQTEAITQPTFEMQIRLLQAICHEQLGQIAAQVQMLERVLTIDAGQLTPRLRLASIYHRQGRFDDANREMALAIRNPYASLAVVAAGIRMQIANCERKNAPANEWNAIQTQIDAIQGRFRQADEPHVLQSEFHLARHDSTQAIAALKKQLQSRGTSPSLWVAMAEAVRVQHGTLAALQVVEEGQSLLGDSVELRLAKANFLLGDPHRNPAASSADWERPGEAWNDNEKLRLESGLTDLYLSHGDDAAALRFAKRWLTSVPNEVAVRRELLAAARRIGERDLVSRLEGEILEATKNDAVSTELSSLEKDVPGLRKLMEAYPERLDIAFQLASALRDSGEVQEAWQLVEALVQRNDSELAYRRLQWQLLAEAKRPANEIDRVVDGLVFDYRINEAHLQSILSASTGGEAIRSAVSRRLEKRPTLAFWWANRLSPIERGVGLDRLAASHPKNADGWAFAMLDAVSAKDEPRLTTQLQQARQALPRERFYLLAAESALAIRKLIPAWQPPVETQEEQLAFAKSQFQSFLLRGDAKTARQFLDQILAEQAHGDELKQWATRNRTFLVTMIGTPEERKQAIERVRKEPLDGMATAELRQRAQLLLATVRMGERLDRLNDVKRVQEAVTARPDATLDDWFALAQIHERLGDESKRFAILEKLVEQDPNTWNYRLAWAEACLTRGKPEKIDSLVPELRKRSEEARPRQLLGRYYVLRDQPTQVIALVDEYTQSQAAAPQELATRMRQGCDELDRLARLAVATNRPAARWLVDAALERYRTLQRSQPDVIAAMAGLLAIDRQLPRALDLLAKSKDRLPPTLINRAAVEVLRGGQASESQLATVRGWLEASLRQEPDSVTTMAQLAELATLEQNYPVAERWYRNILDRDPKNLVALNNLAWIIAPRKDASEQAFDLVDRAIAINGHSGELVDTRSRILLASGNVAEASSSLQTAIEKQPTALSYFHLALCQMQANDMAKSLQSFRAAKAKGLMPTQVHPADQANFRLLETRLVDQ